MIPYGQQHVTEADISAVVDVLKSDYLTQGPVIKRFEEAFADYVGADYAVAVANGTGALQMCAAVLDVQEGDQVITTPITFVASANCVRYMGGEVVFADIDPDSLLLDVHKVRELLQTSGDAVKGLIPVEFAGRAVDMEAFRSLADEFGLWIIEDACHAPGGFFTDKNKKRQMCGNGQYADLSVFSFHPVKHIATGEGGMITTNNEDLYNKLLKLRTHGITRDSNEFVNSAEFAWGMETKLQKDTDPQSNTGSVQNGEYPGWYMEMQTLGFNYRLTDFQAALGLSQLTRADDGIIRRREIAETYASYLKNKPYIRRQAGVVEGHAYHFYVVEVEDRPGLYQYLREHDIYSQIHYIPVHLMPYYRQLGWKEGDFPIAESYYTGCLSLPVFPTLTNDKLMYVIETVKQFYES